MDVEKVIDQLGGRHALQTLLGVGPSAISNYIARGYFPRRVQTVIEAALQDLPAHITPAHITDDKISPVMLPPANRGNRIALIIGGGIAAYKALELTRRLQDHGFHVTGIMTRSAQQFITPLSLSALSGEKVYTDLFSLTDEAEMGHIRLARETDLVLVVPATANLMARAAAGIADDLASTILLATTAPVMMAPAMNPAMWSHPATQDNLARLQDRGVHFIGPDSGDTACGEEGAGRMTSPLDIVTHVQAALHPDSVAADQEPRPLAGKHAIVTSGPTVEPIDSVRFIANHSSGKQGHAIAAALTRQGADVTLVSGPVTIDPPQGVTLISVETAQQMHDACIAALPADIAVCAAAVADWRARSPQNHKIKKQAADSMTIDLVKNPDILAALGAHEKRPELLVGFAAETENLEANARHKRNAKNCDWIVANLVAIASDAGKADDLVFGHDSNTVMLIRDSKTETWPKMRKTEIADKLVEAMIKTLNQKPTRETSADRNITNV